MPRHWRCVLQARSSHRASERAPPCATSGAMKIQARTHADSQSDARCAADPNSIRTPTLKTTRAIPRKPDATLSVRHAPAPWWSTSAVQTPDSTAGPRPQQHNQGAMPRNDQGWPSLPCGPRRATRHVSTSSAIPITTPAGAAMRTGPPALRKRGPPLRSCVCSQSSHPPALPRPCGKTSTEHLTGAPIRP